MCPKNSSSLVLNSFTYEYFARHTARSSASICSRIARIIFQSRFMAISKSGNKALTGLRRQSGPCGSEQGGLKSRLFNQRKKGKERCRSSAWTTPKKNSDFLAEVAMHPKRPIDDVQVGKNLPRTTSAPFGATFSGVSVFLCTLCAAFQSIVVKMRFFHNEL